MLALVAKRLGVSVVLVFLISLLTFVLQSLAPGDVAKAILTEGRGVTGGYTPEAYAQLREELGLNDPVLLQYWHWLGDALRGDLGTSPITGLEVTSMIADRLPVTLSLVVLGTLANALIGVALGVVSAVRGGRLGRALDVFSLAGYALPNFWLALILMSIFAVTLGLLPATGYVSLASSPRDWALSLILPVATIAIQGVASFAKQTRDSMLEAMSQDYVRMLRANGASERSIVYRHALRNAAIPVVTMVGLAIIGIFAGAVFIESVFALPGMGRLTVEATESHDLMTLQGVVIVFTLVVVAVNLLVDLIYGWLNPKVRVT